MTNLGRQRQSEIATRAFGPLAMTNLGRQRQCENATRPAGLLAMTLRLEWWHLALAADRGAVPAMRAARRIGAQRRCGRSGYQCPVVTASRLEAGVAVSG
jgi:hypothetical protein